MGWLLETNKKENMGNESTTDEKEGRQKGWKERRKEGRKEEKVVEEVEEDIMI